MKRTVFSVLFIVSTLSLYAQSASEVRRDFENRYALVSCDDARQALSLAETSEEREALEFLYAYMDWADIFDQTGEYFLENARVALRTRTEMPWGKKVPDREWRHFVLPVRVNNENLDDFRTEYYDELAKRVRGCTMREAVLEVNHWCHEYVTYRPSDARTSSPTASMKTATGRCGEESTFTVAALRAIGIPARQVYTPRWAHTDDNHAWVEAYVDGKWYFLGACEPAPDLNIAWFNQPASRGMLMNTTVLGRYRGKEQILRQMPTQTTINVTENYAPTATTTVRVLDLGGTPVRGATVRFGLYNYGEFYSLYQTSTDTRGEASLVSGLGDMVVWAAADGMYGFEKVSAGKQKKAWDITLSHQGGETFATDLDITPPPVGANLPHVAPEVEAVNNRRLAYEDSVRMAYVRVWPSDSKIEEIAEVLGFETQQILPLFKKSEGNFLNLFDVLATFNSDSLITLGGTTKAERDFFLDFLSTLSDKDLRDFDAFTVADHFQSLLLKNDGQRRGKMSPEAYDRYLHYVMSPRISNEMLSTWRSGLWQYIDAGRVGEYRANPALVADLLNERVETLDGVFARYICMSPVSVMRSGYGDVFSKGLCFVALCRTMGIPARFDEVTSRFQYFTATSASEGEWQTVNFGTAAPETTTSSGVRLRLAYEPRKFMENPRYYNHFTLSRLVGGMPQLQNYGEEDTWENPFREGTSVEPGDYLLVSGTRMADGSVRARLVVFPVQKNVAVKLQMREDADGVQVIGSFNSENLYYDVKDGAEKSVLATTGRGYYVVGLLRAGNEPSTHILHDIEQQRAALESWGREMIMLFPTHEEYDMFMARRSEFPNLPSNLRFGVDEGGHVANDIFGSGLTQSPERPVVLLGDTFNRVVYFSQGYTIGLGDQLRSVIGKLKE
ncbi:MAG: transglutaminase domain-containing protein [Bacteroidales bacterium]|nr:transglutaminase domain-containing protein [Bacteroidales bacterium]